MSTKAAGRMCFMRQKISQPELGCGWRTKGWGKSRREAGILLTRQCAILFFQGRVAEMLCSWQWEKRGDTQQMSAVAGILFPSITKIRGKALLSIKAVGPNFKGLLFRFAMTIATPVPLGRRGGFFFCCFSCSAALYQLLSSRNKLWKS